MTRRKRAALVMASRYGEQRLKVNRTGFWEGDQNDRYLVYTGGRFLYMYKGCYGVCFED